MKNPDFSTPVSILLRFGAVDLAFDALEVTYFGGVLDGRRIPPPDANARRSTAPLWGAAILEHRDDTRFASILKRVGLEDYWRKSGSQPDFRRR
jgi:hypothetical protein